jgi:hypothetical protein
MKYIKLFEEYENFNLEEELKKIDSHGLYIKERGYNRPFIDIFDNQLFIGVYNVKNNEFVLFTYNPHDDDTIDGDGIPPEIKIKGDFADKFEDFYKAYKTTPRTSFREYNKR